jgi:ribosome-associated protein
MKVKPKGVRRVFIDGEHIRLDALLKFASVVSSGGQAKMLIQNGEVCCGGEPCGERGRKIKPGSVVTIGCLGTAILVKRSEERDELDDDT